MESNSISIKADEAQKRLLEGYVKHVDLALLTRLSIESPKLSGLFVPSVTDSYMDAPLRVMIIGKETRAWGKGLSEVGQFSTIEDYIRRAMGRHEKVLAAPPLGSKFFQFYRQAEKSLANGQVRRGSIVWANLFCLAHDKKSPVGQAGFECVKKLSAELLRHQLEVLEPDVVLFVTGYQYDRYIKSFFCVKHSKVHVSKALWELEINGVKAYRTAHPQWTVGASFRARALEMAACFTRKEPSSREELLSV